MPKIRFFDLPCEIRLCIYEQILPADRMLTHSSSVVPGEKILRAACKTDVRLKREITKLARQQCGARFIISPSSPLTPAMLNKMNLEFAAKNKIEIVMNHYDLKSPEKSLFGMYLDLLELGGKLWEYRNLNELSVWFNDTATKPPCILTADPHWCQLRVMPESGGLNYVAKTTRTNGIPVVEYLLRHLLHLPVCKKVCITPPKGMIGLPSGAGFDKHYLDHLCRDMEEFLRVRNSGKPFWTCWGRLEVLRDQAQRSQRPYSNYRGDLWERRRDDEVTHDEDVNAFDDMWED